MSTIGALNWRCPELGCFPCASVGLSPSGSFRAVSVVVSIPMHMMFGGVLGPGK